VKNTLSTTAVAERHAVSKHVHQAAPGRSLRHLCELLEVNRAWYYARPAEEAGVDPDVELRDATRQRVLDFPGYGYRRVTAALHREGWSITQKRVLRVMQEEALVCQLKRPFVLTTDAHHRCQVSPNLLADRERSAPHHAWVADITAIRLPTCFVYLACLLDADWRRCVGWKLSRLIDTKLALGALDLALATRHIQPGLIHHSDRGVQSASTVSVERLGSVQAQVSRSAIGNPYDNAKAESFFKTLKREEVYLKQDQTFPEAQATSAHFIEEVYHTKRLHSSLGYRPPVAFEEAHILNSRV
jgi:putative transposase